MTSNYGQEIETAFPLRFPLGEKGLTHSSTFISESFKVFSNL